MSKQPITQEQADKILAADVANIIKRVRDGKTLTREQRALMLDLADGGPSANAVGTAKTLVELAEALGVSRRSLTNWRKLEGAPKAASNGSHPVNEWRIFLRGQGLAGDAGETAMDDTEGDIEKLKLRKLQAEVGKREHELSVQQGNYLLTDQVRESIRRLVGESIALLRNKLEDELPPVLAGLDAHRIRTELMGVVDQLCVLMHRGASGQVPHPSKS